MVLLRILRWILVLRILLILLSIFRKILIRTCRALRATSGSASARCKANFKNLWGKPENGRNMVLVLSRRASAQREGMQAPQCELNFKNFGTTAGAHCFILVRISHWILIKDFLKDFIPRNKDDIKSLQYPFGVQGRFTRRSPKRQVVRVNGWVGGWVGGDQKCPSIFLIFQYVKK